MKWLTMAMVTLALAMPVLAADGGTNAPTRVRGVAKEVKADSGKTDSGTIVVTVNDEAQTFVVKSDTIVRKGEDHPKFNEVKAGDKVRVDYTEVGGKKVASKLRVENDE